MLILFVCNIYAPWSLSMFDVVLNFPFLQTCGNVYVGAPERRLYCGSLLLRHLQRKVALAGDHGAGLWSFCPGTPALCRLVLSKRWRAAWERPAAKGFVQGKINLARKVGLD